MATTGACAIIALFIWSFFKYGKDMIKSALNNPPNDSPWGDEPYDNDKDAN